jgi:hypothetical protein
MTSATNERQIQRAKDQQAKDRRGEVTVIQALMSTVDGRRWVWLQLEFARCFVEDSGLDPFQMAYDKGRRNTGLKLLASVTQHTPQMYIRMTQENTGVQLEDTADDNPDSDPVS